MSPYGSTKAACERLIEGTVSAAVMAGAPFSAAILRYFNVCGAGAGPFGEPIAGSTMMFASAKFFSMWCRGGGALHHFGTDYPTPMERAYGITSTWMMWWPLMRSWAIVWSRGACRYHVGTGKGTSVQEAVEAARPASSHPIPVILGDRRPVDADSVMADSSRLQALGWTPGHATLLPCSCAESFRTPMRTRFLPPAAVYFAVHLPARSHA